MSIRNCPACGAEAPEKARFCLSCGKEIGVQVCQNCGAQVPANARFCLNCGKEITPTSLSTAPARIEAATKKPSRRRWLRPLNLLIIAAIVMAIVGNRFLDMDDEAKQMVAAIMFVGGFLTFLAALVALLIQAVRKRKRKGWAITTGLSLVLLIVAAAIGTHYDSPKEETAITQPEVTPVTAPVPVETLEQVLAKASNITSAKFDMVATAGGPQETATIWWKGNKTRMDITANGASFIILELLDTRTLITYSTTEKRGDKEQLRDGAESTLSPADIAQKILKQNPLTLGPEAMDDRAAILIEGTDEDGQKYRAWIEKEHGFPLRIDTWTPEGKTVVELRNAEFFYIPDSMFEVPLDVQLTTVPPAVPTPSSSPTPTATPSPVPLPVTVPRLYTNPDSRYSIEVLEGWTINDSDKASLVLRAPEGGAAVFITAYTTPATLESWAESLVSYRRSKYPDYQELSRTKSMLPGSLPVYAINDKYAPQPDNRQQRFLNILTVKGNRRVNVQATTWETDWDKDSSQLEKIAYSLAMAE